jgi:hypothetical protein
VRRYSRSYMDKYQHSGETPASCPECTAEIVADPMPCRCPSQWLFVTLGEAESAFRDGRMSQGDFDAYRCAWQRSEPRFADYAFVHDHCRDSKEWRPIPRPI